MISPESIDAVDIVLARKDRAMTPRKTRIDDVVADAGPAVAAVLPKLPQLQVSPELRRMIFRDERNAVVTDIVSKVDRGLHQTDLSGDNRSQYSDSEAGEYDRGPPAAFPPPPMAHNAAYGPPPAGYYPPQNTFPPPPQDTFAGQPPPPQAPGGHPGYGAYDYQPPPNTAVQPGETPYAMPAPHDPNAGFAPQQQYPMGQQYGAVPQGHAPDIVSSTSDDHPDEPVTGACPHLSDIQSFFLSPH